MPFRVSGKNIDVGEALRARRLVSGLPEIRVAKGGGP